MRDKSPESAIPYKLKFITFQTRLRPLSRSSIDKRIPSTSWKNPKNQQICENRQRRRHRPISSVLPSEQEVGTDKRIEIIAEGPERRRESSQGRWLREDRPEAVTGLVIEESRVRRGSDGCESDFLTLPENRAELTEVVVASR